jgi:hypothetical protein
MAFFQKCGILLGLPHFFSKVTTLAADLTGKAS